MREINRLNFAEHDARLEQIGARARRIWEIIALPIEEEIQARKIKSFDAFEVAALFDSMLRFYCLNQFGKFRSLESNETDETVTFVVSIFFDGVAERKLKG